MGDAPQEAPPPAINENSFWENFMPAGKQAAAAASGPQAAESMDVDATKKKDDKGDGGDTEFDDRGGKWAKEQNGRGKGRSSGRGGARCG